MCELNSEENRSRVGVVNNLIFFVEPAIEPGNELAWSDFVTVEAGPRFRRTLNDSKA